MRDPILFELCAETKTACLAARAGGAHRLELCRRLEVGGLTPDRALLAFAVQQSGLPVHVLLRPTASSFRSSPEVLKSITVSLHEAVAEGTAGLVLGLLGSDGRVDVEHTRGLVELAAPLPVTFHRAFDATPDLEEALEDVIATGCQRVLTSGGAANVLAGSAILARLVRQAGSRIEVIVGGGLTLENARNVAQRTGARNFHGSLRMHGSVSSDAAALRNEGTPEEEQQALEARIRRMVRALNEAHELVGADYGAGIS